MVDLTRRMALAAPALGGVFLARAGSGATPVTGFDFTFQALEGGELPLGQFRGRVLLVVNTASFCGFTAQYAALQRLHDRYQAEGLTVLGVPSNDFHQESTDASRVREFCETRFGITFPMADLSRVRGPAAHPFFAWAGAQAGPQRWNFHKYLMARDGRRVAGFSTHVEPDAPTVMRAIEAALATRG